MKRKFKIKIGDNEYIAEVEELTDETVGGEDKKKSLPGAVEDGGREPDKKTDGEQ